MGLVQTFDGYFSAFMLVYFFGRTVITKKVWVGM